MKSIKVNFKSLTMYSNDFDQNSVSGYKIKYFFYFFVISTLNYYNIKNLSVFV